MSNVVISNRSIFNQKVANIGQNQVALPFNVSKIQVEKLVKLLTQVKVTFLSETDTLNISELTYNDTNIKSNDRTLTNCRFTLSKTYVVTMKQSFISKVKSFYDRLIEIKIPERPIFNIGNETNLQAALNDNASNIQEALKEATAEIDLSAIQNSLENEKNIQITVPEEPSPQVLANSPLGETIIENPVNLNTSEPQVSLPEVPEQTDTPIDNSNTHPEEQPQVTPNVVEQPSEVIATTENETTTDSEDTTSGKKEKRKKSKGSVLAIPIVVIWLGLVFYGTLKLVTSILT